ncbi:MAG: hypothetical protein AAF629_23485 [Chloroflexota bacterium]
MSCQKNANVINKFACRASGVTEQVGASAYLAAQSLNRATFDTAKTVSQTVDQLSTGASKSPTLNRIVRRSPPMLGFRMFNRTRQVVQRLSPANRVGQMIGRMTGIVGTIQGEFSRQGKADSVTLDRKVFGVKVGQQIVPIWRSSLTPFLNRSNQFGVGEKVKSSKGVLVKGQGVTWHCGTTTADLPDGGGERTVTQVRSLSYPSSHYFFNRSLTNQETAELVTGQTKANTLSGYVGEIAPTESVVPAIVSIKRHYYQSKIYAGEDST